MEQFLSIEYYLAMALGYIVPVILGGVIGWLGARVKHFAARQRHSDKLDMILLRMAIYNEHFDIDEKLEAYALYREKGGNHHTKKYMDDLLGMDVDDYLDTHK